MEKNQLGILVPAYNESKNLQLLIPNLKKLGKLLVVNDGSTDRTTQVLKQRKCLAINFRKNRGYEKAIIAGLQYFKKSNVQYVLTFDADGQHQFKDIVKIKKYLQNSVTDLYIFNRFQKNRFSENILNFIFKLKFNLQDPISGMKAYNISSLKKINLNTVKNKLLVDLTYFFLKKNYKIKNILVYTKKRSDKPRIGPSWRVNIKILYIALYFLLKG
mgnify:CR=1 FL=1